MKSLAPTAKQPATGATSRTGFLYDYIRSLFSTKYRQKQVAELNTCCLFIGYPRSGHSLVGSLLDAHPNIIIAHELNLLEYIKRPFNRRQICSLLLRNSQVFAQFERQWSGYTYLVPGEWNGRYDNLQVIGDKRGGATGQLLAKHPHLYTRLQQKMNLPIKFIHVTRNPFDNISTMAKASNIPLSEALYWYFTYCDNTRQVIDTVPESAVLTVAHEHLIERPEATLTRLCAFLDQAVTETYLEHCAAIIFKKAHESRHDAPWTDDLITQVNDKMTGYPFLQMYQ